jgi:VanZ family protein
VWAWGPAVLYAATLFTLSSFSALPSPPIGISDKVEHFAAYAGFALTLLWGLSSARLSAASWRTALGAVTLASLYGVTDEIHQYFVPGRSCDVRDWIADTSGAALAVAVGLLITRVVRRARAD